MVSTFSIKIDCSRAGALVQVDAAKAGPDSVKDFTPDQTQINAVKPFIKDRIAELPERFDGVLIIAQGTSDLENGRSICEVQVYGKTGHL